MGHFESDLSYCRPPLLPLRGFERNGLQLDMLILVGLFLKSLTASPCLAAPFPGCRIPSKLAGGQPTAEAFSVSDQTPDSLPFVTRNGTTLLVSCPDGGRQALTKDP